MHLDEAVTSAVATTEDLARLLRLLRRRQARQRKGPEPTYRELARTTGWAHSAIGLYMTGKVLPPTDRFDELIQLLGATPAEQGRLATARDRLDERRREAPPAAPAQPAPPARVPRQLPADLQAFAGRAQVLAELDRLVTEGGARTAVVVSTVAGTAGVGKTTLAVHWAHSVTDRFPDGQLYVNLRGFDPDLPPLTAAQALRGFFEALSVPASQIPTDVDGQNRLYRSLLADRRVLVLLDNAATADQVRPLLPGAPGCRVLVTSRNQLTSLVALEAAHPVALDLMTVGEARALLSRRLGAERLAREPDTVDELIELCARLPLALAVVAAQAIMRPDLRLATIIEQVRTAPGRLDALHAGDTATDMRSVFSWSYRQLSTDAAKLFRLLAVHPGPDITRPAMASLSADAGQRVKRSLDELMQANLLTEYVPGRYVFHDLLRLYAGELARSVDGEQGCRAAQHRMLSHYLHTAHPAALVLADCELLIEPAESVAGVSPESLDDRDQVMAWFTAEREVLLAVIRHALDNRWDVHAWQLTWCLTDFFAWTGDWRDWAVTDTDALAATVRLGDRRGQATIHRLLGTAFLRLDQIDEAKEHYQCFLAISRERDDVACQALAHRDLGRTSEREGRLTDALDHCQQAADLYSRTGDGLGHAKALSAVGWYTSLLGDHHRAVSLCEAALAVLQRAGVRESEAGAWHSLGHAYQHLGDHQKAIDCYQRAADLCRDLGARYNESETYLAMADVHEAGGSSPDTCLRQALAILEDLGHPDATKVRARLRREPAATDRR